MEREVCPDRMEHPAFLANLARLVRRAPRARRALLVPLVPMVKAMVITINAGVIELRPLVCGLYMQTSICFLLHEKRKKSVALLTRLREQMNRV